MAGFVRTVVFLHVLVFVCACSGEQTWRGDYRYQAALGQTVGGTPIIVEYELHISGESGCRLSIDGYQVSEIILCDPVKGEDRLEVRFKSYADGATANIYGVQVYKPGEALFVLLKRDGELVTRWESLYPGEQAPPAGHYFFEE